MQKLPFLGLVLSGLVSVSLGQQIVKIPGFGDMIVSAEDTPCVYLATKFGDDIKFGERSGRCWATALEVKRWAKFRVGFSGAFFPEIRETTGPEDCHKKANELNSAERFEASRMCVYLSLLLRYCQCDPIACVTEDVIDAISPSTAAICTDFPEKVCLVVQEIADTACHIEIERSPSNFDRNAVPHTCDATDCRNPASSGSGSGSGSGIKMSTGGAFLSAAVAAFATMVL